MRKEYFLKFLLITLLFTSVVSANELSIVYHNFPPYEFQENNKPAGIMVDVVQSIFEKADIPMELKFTPFKRALVETKSGVNDGLFILYKTPERMEYFDYTEPVISSPLVFFVRKDSNIKFQQLSDLKGLKIGIFRGYTYGSEFDNYPGYTLEPADSHEANMKKLMFGRIDAYICDQTVGFAAAIKSDTMSELKTLPNPLNTMKLYMVFTKDKHQGVLDKINPIIKSMNASGEIDKLIDNFLTQLY